MPIARFILVDHDPENGNQPMSFCSKECRDVAESDTGLIFDPKYEESDNDFRCDECGRLASEVQR